MGMELRGFEHLTPRLQVIGAVSLHVPDSPAVPVLAEYSAVITVQIDVELQRDAALRGVVGSVGKQTGGHIAVAILDSDWATSGRGEYVDPSDPVVRMAAHLAINEHDGEYPWPLVQAKGLQHYRIDSSFFEMAERRLGRK